jgi:hypothetical protein
MAQVAKRTKAARAHFEGKANLTVEAAVDLIKQARPPSSTKPLKSR